MAAVVHVAGNCGFCEMWVEEMCHLRLLVPLSLDLAGTILLLLLLSSSSSSSFSIIGSQESLRPGVTTFTPDFVQTVQLIQHCRG